MKGHLVIIFCKTFFCLTLCIFYNIKKYAIHFFPGNGAKSKFYGVNNENSFFATRGNYEFFIASHKYMKFFFFLKFRF